MFRIVFKSYMFSVMFHGWSVQRRLNYSKTMHIKIETTIVKYQSTVNDANWQ